MESSGSIKLGLRENWRQFTLLVIINSFVGALIGLERSILPRIAEEEFAIEAKTAILSFIIVFGLTKALLNYFAGRYSERFGRKTILIWGWIAAIPVPILLIWAPSWKWILLANVFLGINQGLAWSTTVIMKIDLAGAQRRGLAMGLNEFAGYVAVALSALATGYIADQVGLHPQPFYLGILYVVVGLFMSLFLVKETKGHAELEGLLSLKSRQNTLSQKEIFKRTSFSDKNLSAVTQAGFVNNLNDGMAWGLFPILFGAHNLGLKEIGILAALYPATSGVLQLWTGHLSDIWGRKWMIASGMWVQALGIGLTAIGQKFFHFALGSALLGIGTAMVYPTLLAAIGDIAQPSWRASSVGIYRLWRDAGYAVGAILAGFIADAFGLEISVWVVALLTFGSGLMVALRMSADLRPHH